MDIYLTFYELIFKFVFRWNLTDWQQIHEKLMEKKLIKRFFCINIDNYKKYLRLLISFW